MMPLTISMAPSLIASVTTMPASITSGTQPMTTLMTPTITPSTLTPWPPNRLCDPSENPFYFWFHGIFGTSVYFLGFVGNLAFIPVFVSLLVKSRHKKTGTAVSLSEFYVVLLVLLLTSVVQLFIVMWEWSLRNSLYLFQVYFDWSGPIVDFLRENNETINSYVLVVISINRYKACCIKWKDRHLGVTKTFGVACLITLLSFLFHLPRLFEDVYLPFYDFCLKSNSTKHAPAPWRENNAVYLAVYKVIANYVVTFIVPFVSLFLLNASIVIVIKRQNRYHRSAVSSPSKTSAAAERQVLRVCFVVVVTFFLTKFPYFVVACFRHIEAVLTKDVAERISKTKEYQDFRSICIFLVNVNFCLTFVTYALFAPAMRNHFLRFYGIRADQRKANGGPTEDPTVGTPIGENSSTESKSKTKDVEPKNDRGNEKEEGKREKLGKRSEETKTEIGRENEGANPLESEDDETAKDRIGSGKILRFSSSTASDGASG